MKDIITVMWMCSECFDQQGNYISAPADLYANFDLLCQSMITCALRRFLVIGGSSALWGVEKRKGDYDTLVQWFQMRAWSVYGIPSTKGVEVWNGLEMRGGCHLLKTDKAVMRIRMLHASILQVC